MWAAGKVRQGYTFYHERNEPQRSLPHIYIQSYTTTTSKTKRPSPHFCPGKLCRRKQVLVLPCEPHSTLCHYMLRPVIRYSPKHRWVNFDLSCPPGWLLHPREGHPSSTRKQVQPPLPWRGNRRPESESYRTAQAFALSLWGFHAYELLWRLQLRRDRSWMRCSMRCSIWLMWWVLACGPVDICWLQMMRWFDRKQLYIYLCSSCSYHTIFKLRTCRSLGPPQILFDLGSICR